MGKLNWGKSRINERIRRQGTSEAIHDLPVPKTKRGKRRWQEKLDAKPDPVAPSTQPKMVAVTIRCECGHEGRVFSQSLAPGKNLVCRSCGKRMPLDRRRTMSRINPRARRNHEEPDGR